VQKYVSFNSLVSQSFYNRTHFKSSKRTTFAEILNTQVWHKTWTWNVLYVMLLKRCSQVYVGCFLTKLTVLELLSICQCTIINVFRFKETFQSLQDIENNSKWIFKRTKYFQQTVTCCFWDVLLLVKQNKQKFVWFCVSNKKLVRQI
jgi:hypothetical protein